VADVRDSGTPTFTHSAFLYDSDAAYTGFLVPFICEGLGNGEAVAVAASRRRIAALSAALGPDAGAVRFLPADEWYDRPVRIIAGWFQALRTAATAGRPAARLVNEIPFSEPTLSWVRCESAMNVSLRGHSGHLLCPYDRRALPPHLIASAAETHHLLYDRGWHHSDAYVPPERLLADRPEPVHPATGMPILDVAILDTVADLRAHLRDRATEEGWLPQDRIEILVLAVTEVATNGIRHGGSRRRLRVWLNPEAVVCEVSDDGATPPGPLAGYLPPVPGEVGGMGLWLVNQVCDAVSVRAADGRTDTRFTLYR
jgi:anti-sigma regulatory factor (Ser/Thr protein kinase)